MSLEVSRFSQALEEARLSGFFPPESREALIRYTHRMLEINETLNLTRWTGDEEVLNFHLLDSALALPTLQALKMPLRAQWLDLGTGCGFPGVVLAAAFPLWQVTFLDSVVKKTKAVAECLTASSLSGKTLSLRAEDLGRGSRETWDGVTSRAVADFPVALEYALPLLKIGGYFVNWITENQRSTVESSSRALQELGGKVTQITDYSLSGGTQKRSLVVVEKVGKTPDLYPRPTGRASKSPLV